MQVISAGGWAFLTAAVRRPQLVGAIAPSGPALCDQLAAVVPSHGIPNHAVPNHAVPSGPVVVELGPGTGVVSRAIRRRLPTSGRQLAVELDPAMVDHLARHAHWLQVLQGDAAHLRELLAGSGVPRVDAVVSGLPWSLVDPPVQRRTLEAITDVLAPTGAFTTFGYLHALPVRRAREFRALLRRRFDEVVVSRTVWSNVPPAVVFVCRRPIGGARPTAG